MNKRELKKVAPLLELLEKASAKDRITYLKYINTEGRDAIYNCIENGLCNVQLSDLDIKNIRKAIGEHKNIYRYLINKEEIEKDEKRHKKLIQVGGSLGIIIGTVLPFLHQYLSEK